MNVRRLVKWFAYLSLPLALFAVAPYFIPRRRRPLYHGHELASPGDRFVSVDGFNMRYQVAGEEHTDNLPLILIHGMASSVVTWYRNIDALAQKRRVYAIDLKGWGLTDKPGNGDYSLLQQAHHVRAFMQALSLERAVIVGHSMGGAIAVIAAAEYPREIAGIVLIDPAGGRSLSYLWLISRLMEVPPLRRWAVLAAQYAVTNEPLLTAAMPRAYYDPATHFTPEMKRALLQPYHTHGYIDAVISSARHTRHHHIVSRVPHIDCPTLIVWGEQDVVLPVGDAHFFLDAIHGARLELLPEAGHNPHEERAEDVNRLIEEFAAGVEGVALPADG